MTPMVIRVAPAEKRILPWDDQLLCGKERWQGEANIFMAKFLSPLFIYGIFMAVWLGEHANCKSDS